MVAGGIIISQLDTGAVTTVPANYVFHFDLCSYAVRLGNAEADMNLLILRTFPSKRKGSEATRK